jgi:hypothetical protein
MMGYEREVVNGEFEQGTTDKGQIRVPVRGSCASLNRKRSTTEITN